MRVEEHEARPAVQRVGLFNHKLWKGKITRRPPKRSVWGGGYLTIVRVLGPLYGELVRGTGRVERGRHAGLAHLQG